jgi:hypothetical protein
MLKKTKKTLQKFIGKDTSQKRSFQTPNQTFYPELFSARLSGKARRTGREHEKVFFYRKPIEKIQKDSILPFCEK